MDVVPQGRRGDGWLRLAALLVTAAAIYAGLFATVLGLACAVQWWFERIVDSMRGP